MMLVIVIAPAETSSPAASTSMNASRCARPKVLALYPTRLTDDSIAARAGGGGDGGAGGGGGAGGVTQTAGMSCESMNCSYDTVNSDCARFDALTAYDTGAPTTH